MKKTALSLSMAAAVTVANLWCASAAYATTQPSAIASFTAEAPTQTLTARFKSWRDPAFGDMGWTHHSSWGSFQATKGQMVTITVNSPDAADFHPGVTVWYRDTDKDTAPDTYVNDHFYVQNAPQFVLSAKDETSGEVVGNIVMRAAAWGYDADGIKGAKIPGLNGQKNGTPGQLVLKFKAKNTGTYLFVEGGLLPGAGIINNTASTLYNLQTTVTVE
jgi:hypothetical protein